MEFIKLSDLNKYVYKYVTYKIIFHFMLVIELCNKVKENKKVKGEEVESLRKCFERQ